MTSRVSRRADRIPSVTKPGDVDWGSLEYGPFSENAQIEKVNVHENDFSDAGDWAALLPRLVDGYLKRAQGRVL